MINSRWCAVAALALLLAGSARAETVEEAEKHLIEVWAKHKSLTATLGLSGAMPQSASMNGSGRFELLRRDGKDLIRVEVSSTTVFGEGAQQQTVESRTLSISDGTECLTLQEQLGRKVVYRLSADHAQQLGGAEAMKSVHRDHDVSLKPDEKFEGRTVCVLDAVLREPGPQQPVRRRNLYFDRDTGTMLKMVTLDAGGNAIEVMTITDVRINEEVDPARFVMQVPPDATVVDETGTVLATPAPVASPGPAGSPAPASSTAPAGSPSPAASAAPAAPAASPPSATPKP